MPMTGIKPEEITRGAWDYDRDHEDEMATHPCDNHPSNLCMCEGACSCHFVQTPMNVCTCDARPHATFCALWAPAPPEPTVTMRRP
jgi:hypothetical protein